MGKLDLHDVVSSISEVLKLNRWSEQLFGDSKLGGDEVDVSGGIRWLRVKSNGNPLDVGAVIHGVGTKNVLSEIVSDHVNGLDSITTFFHNLVFHKLVMLQMRSTEVLEFGRVAMSSLEKSFERLLVGSSSHEQVFCWRFPAVFGVDNVRVCKEELNKLWVNCMHVAVLINCRSSGIVLHIDPAISGGNQIAEYLL